MKLIVLATLVGGMAVLLMTVDLAPTSYSSLNGSASTSVTTADQSGSIYESAWSLGASTLEGSVLEAFVEDDEGEDNVADYLMGSVLLSSLIPLLGKFLVCKEPQKLKDMCGSRLERPG